MEDGSFITSDAIREAADRLEVALKAVSKGSFKSDKEKDEMTYALGTPEHIGCVRGMGVVPLKHGFSGDIETYRSRQRRKAEVAKKVRALEERVASIEGAIATSQKPDQLLNWRLASLARSDSSVASMEHPAAEEMVVEHYPVDDIAVRTPCELLFPLRKKNESSHSRGC